VRQTFDGAALVGDAAGYVDPFTGEGVHGALAGSKALAECLLALPPRTAPTAADLEPYARARKSAVEAHDRAALVLQRGLRHPWIVRGALSLLQWRPRLAELAVAVTGDYLEPAALLRPKLLWKAVAL
jgi:flavin-dependent dehydrogenase